jgi:hypothetical protein
MINFTLSFARFSEWVVPVFFLGGQLCVARTELIVNQNSEKIIAFLKQIRIFNIGIIRIRG